MVNRGGLGKGYTPRSAIVGPGIAPGPAAPLHNERGFGPKWAEQAGKLPQPSAANFPSLCRSCSCGIANEAPQILGSAVLRDIQ